MGSAQTSPALSSGRLGPEPARSSQAPLLAQIPSYTGARSEHSLQPETSPRDTPASLPGPIRTREGDWWNRLQAFELYELLDGASKFPPITEKSLSELDMPRFLNDQLLRHNLNFEAFAQFWPNYNTDFGRQCRAAARRYWAALEVELVLFMKPNRIALAFEPTRLREQGLLDRLPGLFETLKNILRVLLRQDQALAVEEFLEVPFIMQQIENNACDLAKLAEWVATVLTTSCSPQRDGEVVQAADQIKMAATRGDPSAMVDGIESLFSMLETMKLDAANHQIRCLRNDLVNDNVAFEQRLFFNSQQDATTSQSRAWFERQCQETYFAEDGEIFQSTPAQSFDVGQSAVVRAIVEHVAIPTHPLPATFDFDCGRLGQLVQDFELHLRQVLLSETVTVFLRRAWGRDILDEREIDQIVTRTQLIHRSAGLGAPPPLLDIALEVFRAINRHYGRRHGGAAVAPDDAVLRILLGRLRASAAEHAALRERLRGDLLERARHEIAEVAGATPLYMHNRYAAVWHQRSQGPVPTMESMARRIAHVAILHWRVWGPILYQQPNDADSIWGDG